MEAAHRTSRWVTVFLQHRYSPDFLKIQKILESGILGRVFLIQSRWSTFARRWDWQSLRKHGGGILNNTAPHALDQLLQLFVAPDPQITCQLDRIATLGDAEDHMKLILQAAGEPTIDLEVSSADAMGSQRWKIWGSLGGLAGSAQELNWKYFDPAEVPGREVVEAAPENRTYGQENLPWRHEKWQPPPDMESLHAVFYRDLHRCIEASRPPTVKIEEVVRLTSILEKSRQTAELHKTTLRT
jgi:predicted dehydrogenase